MTAGKAATGRLLTAVIGLCLAVYSAADSTNMQKAYKAMEIAQSYKGQGDLKRAEQMFQLALRNALVDSNVYREAKDELEYYLPLMRIQRLLWEGNAEAVEQELFALQQAFEDQPVRLQQINRIREGLRSAAAADQDQGGGDSELDEKQVIREVTGKLDEYFQQHNRYPTSRSALIEALALDSAPMDVFEIGRYSSNGAGYLLVLRNKEDRSQTITMQKTGLLQ